MKRFFKILVFLFLGLILLLFIYIQITIPKLTDETEAIIEQVIQGELQPLKGEEGFAYNGDIKIWYESILPKDSIKGTVLLIMGISNDALAWPNYFIDPLVASGYQVVRFDNRGTGLSDWMDDWDEDNAYSLSDMANDAVAVLDKLEIDKTHVIGVSLGGMIAQTLSLEHPDRLHTLTSMMSTGYMMDEDLPFVNTKLMKKLVLTQAKYGLVRTEKNAVKLHLTTRQLLRGSLDYQIGVEDLAQSVLYNLRKRKGDNHLAFRQHSAATFKSGSRYEALKTLTTPTLIIHGTTDPLIDFAHGKKCFELIPNATNFWVEGMGHDIPEPLSGEIVGRIVTFYND